MIELSKEDKQLYIHRVFTMCVEMSNTSKMMREVGEDIDIIQLVENTTIQILEHIYTPTYNLEIQQLNKQLLNNATQEEIQYYDNFLKG